MDEDAISPMFRETEDQRVMREMLRIFAEQLHRSMFVPGRLLRPIHPPQRSEKCLMKST